MSIQARLDTLSERHQALEAALRQERAHAALDDMKILYLKRQKLSIKDEMLSLRCEERPS